MAYVIKLTKFQQWFHHQASAVYQKRVKLIWMYGKWTSSDRLSKNNIVKLKPICCSFDKDKLFFSRVLTKENNFEQTIIIFLVVVIFEIDRIKGTNCRNSVLHYKMCQCNVSLIILRLSFNVCIILKMFYDEFLSKVGLKLQI